MSQHACDSDECVSEYRRWQKRSRWNLKVAVLHPQLAELLLLGRLGASYHLCVGNPQAARAARAHEPRPPAEGFCCDLRCRWGRVCQRRLRTSPGAAAPGVSLVRPCWTRWVHKMQLFLDHVMPLPKARKDSLGGTSLIMFNMPVTLHFVLRALPFWSEGPGHSLSSSVKGLSVRSGC